MGDEFDDYYEDFGDTGDGGQLDEDGVATGGGGGGRGGGLFCPNCGSREIDHDIVSGSSTCMKCHVVVEENQIVNSVEFVEGAGGVASKVGQFVSGSRAFGNSLRKNYDTSRTSRENTLANGQRRIQEIASRLRLGGRCMDSAHRLFSIAVDKNFIQGRRTTYVVAACLYIVCRQEKSQHMLIDFADALQVNVYTLGTCFLKFRRLLDLKLEIVDPALYVYRFAAHLDLDEKASAVSITALRLVARMKRDWIVAGRRPAGICAAALLIAARAHGFSKHQQDVTRILRVCGMTVNNRVKEFELTPAARLTLDQFNNTELPDTEADPPSYSRNKIMEARVLAIHNGDTALLASGALDDPRESERKARLYRSDAKETERVAKLKQLYSDLEQELDATLRRNANGTISDKKKLTSGYDCDSKSVPVLAMKQPADPSLVDSEPSGSEGERQAEGEYHAEADSGSKPAVGGDSSANSEAPTALESTAKTGGDEDEEIMEAGEEEEEDPTALDFTVKTGGDEDEEIMQEEEDEDPTPVELTPKTGGDEDEQIMPDEEEEEEVVEEEEELGKKGVIASLSTELVKKRDIVVAKKTVHFRVPPELEKAHPKDPRGRLLVLANHATEEEMQESSAPVETKLCLSEWKENMPKSMESEFDDIFRTEEEEMRKEAIFNKINKDYLEAQERKDSLKRDQEAAAGNVDEDDAAQADKHARYTRRKRKNKQGEADGGVDGTTEEQLRAAVASRKVSRKINYDALSSIFDEDGSLGNVTDTAGGNATGDDAMYDF